MKVKVGNTIYDPNEEPIMLIFGSIEERNRIIKQLSEMPENSNKYCQYPHSIEWVENDYIKIKNWMKDINGDKNKNSSE